MKRRTFVLGTLGLLVGDGIAETQGNGAVTQAVKRLAGGGPYNFEAVKSRAEARVTLNKPTQIEGSNHEVIRSFGKYSHTYIPITAVDPKLILAVLSIEDAGFYGHPGFSVSGLLRAVFKGIGGGSTITQQLVKNVFLTPDQTYARKADEIARADKLDEDLSKNEILELYLNTVSFGEGAYGIEAAAQTYFGKPAAKLSIEESALLVGLVQAPTDYNPFDHPEAAKQRRDEVLQAISSRGKGVLDDMYDHLPKIDKNSLLKEIDLADDKVAANLLQLTRRAGTNSLAPFFSEYVAQQAKAIIAKIKGVDEISNQDFSDMGLTIETTLNPTYQNYAINAMERLKALNSGQNDAKKWIQGGIVSVDKNGRVLAYVGGVDFQKNQYDQVRATRQPGSTFKPFVYATALQKRLITPDQTFPDTSVPDMTVATAIAESNNDIAKKVADVARWDDIKTQAEHMGIHFPEGYEPDENMPIGGGKLSLSLKDMVGAYSAIANADGNLIQPWAIQRISDSQEKELYLRTNPSKSNVISQDSRNAMVSMMKGVVDHGTGVHAQVPGVEIAGKTGTTDDNVDAWFIGFNPDGVTTGVRIGNNDATSMGSGEQFEGKGLPAEIFKRYMEKISSENKSFNIADTSGQSGSTEYPSPTASESPTETSTSTTEEFPTSEPSADDNPPDPTPTEGPQTTQPTGEPPQPTSEPVQPTESSEAPPDTDPSSSFTLPAFGSAKISSLKRLAPASKQCWIA